MKWSDLDERSDWQWVDYAEGELSDEDRQSLELVLSHSQIDREIVQGYKNIKTAVRAAAGYDCDLSDLYYQNLSDRIMTKILKDPGKTCLAGKSVVTEDSNSKNSGKTLRD